MTNKPNCFRMWWWWWWCYPDLFRGTGMWKNLTETQKSGHAPI